MQPYAGSYGMDDLASMLDALRSVGAVLDAAPQYIPVRSIDNSENSFNPIFTSGENNVLESIAAFMKGLLDKGISLLINSHEHTRVCVGYDDSTFVPTFIFADSWGNKVSQEEYDPSGRLVNKIHAGYSQAPISMIVSYVREIVYFDRQAPGTGAELKRFTPTKSIKKKHKDKQKRYRSVQWPAERDVDALKKTDYQVDDNEQHAAGH